jgi:pimeloyl-ACP methyl ester carboxylesterase
MTLNRRKALQAAIGLGAAAGVYRLDQLHHTIPPRDPAAEERFRRLQDALLAGNNVPARSKFLDLLDPSVRAHVLQAGQGAPVLLVHGGNSVAASWTPLLAILHRKFHLYAPDRPGCGLTTKFDYDGVPLRKHAAAFLSSVMDGLELPRATLIGNSMGGYFSLVFALAHPDRVAKLILIGEPAGSASKIRLSHRLIGTRVVNSILYATVLKPGTRSIRSSFERMLVADSSRVPSDYLECLAAGAMIPGAVESWLTMVENSSALPGAGIFDGSATLTWALRPELPRLRAPTLVLWGDSDTFGPPSLGQEMVRLMPEGRCEIIPNAGHLAFVDQPGLCSRLIESFLT